MALTITDKVIRSELTKHTALCSRSGRWHVSWLPGRTLDRGQAVTAMQIAQTVGSGIEPGDRRWPHLDGWAAELGLTGPDAVVRASEPPAGLAELP